MQYSQEHLKTMVYAEFGGQTECIMGNWKIENGVTIQIRPFEQNLVILLLISWEYIRRTFEFFFDRILFSLGTAESAGLSMGIDSEE